MLSGAPPPRPRPPSQGKAPLPAIGRGEGAGSQGELGASTVRTMRQHTHLGTSGLPRFGRRKPAPGRELVPSLSKDGPAAAFAFRSSGAGDSMSSAEAAASAKTWLLAHQYDRKMDTLKREFELKKYFMSEELLTDVFEFMKEEGKLTLEVAAEAKWEELIWLAEKIATPPHDQVRLGGNPYALYERWYKAEPRPLCTQPRFFTVLHCVYGFETASIDRVCDTAMLKRLSRLFNSFDVSASETGEACGKIDWQSLVFGLKLCQSQLVGMRATLEWGFALYTSEGALHVPTAKRTGMISRNAMAELCSVAGVTTSAVKFLKNACNEALAALGDTDANKPEHLQGKSLLDFNDFEAALAQRPLARLLEPSRRRKHLLQWEEWFHPTLQDFLHDARKARFDEEKARLFAEMLRMRRLYEAFQNAFTGYVKRKRARELVISFVEQYETTNERITIDRWLRVTMADVAITTIQRVGRGFVARLYVYWLRKMIGSARIIQTCYRCHMCKKRMRREKRRRVRAATRLQRYWRGRCGRARARVRLLGKFAREHEANIVARWEWELQQRENAANHIQRYWRGQSDTGYGRARAARFRKEKERADAVRIEMGDNAKDFARRLEAHMYTMEQQWKRVRLDAEQKKRDDEKTRVDKLKIIRMQRRRIFIALKEHNDAVTAEEEHKENQRAEVWRRKWRQEMDSRGRAERRRIERVLLAPERGSGEKQERNAIRHMVKVKAKEVMEAEEEAGVPIEQVEADIKALELVKLELIEKAKADVQAEWDEEEEAYQSGKAQEQELLDLEAEETRALDREFASKIVARNWFCFRARTRARLACRAQYTKHYDPSTRTGYYVHKRDGKVKWTKPIIMGSEDLVYEEGWLLLTDTTFDGEPRHFCYEPRSLRMTWSEPPRGEGIPLSEELEAFIFGEGLLRQKIEIHINVHGQGMRGDELIRHLFYSADLDRSGFLDKEELRKVFNRMLAEAYDPSARQPKNPVHHMSELQLDTCIARMDADGDGQVGMRELMDWMHKIPGAVDEDDRAFLRQLAPAQRHDAHREMREVAREEAELLGIDWIDSEEDAEKESEREGTGVGGAAAAGRAAAKEARLAREATGIEQSAAGVAGASAGESPLPAGWSFMDAAQNGGQAYYYNEATGESSWDRPNLPASVGVGAVATGGGDSYGAFAAFDAQGTGYVAVQQLAALLEQLGLYAPERELGAVTALLDGDGDGWVAAVDFHRWYAEGAHMGGE